MSHTLDQDDKHPQVGEDAVKYRPEHHICSDGLWPDRVALSEGHVILMKEQSAFIHGLSRLLKLWDRSLLVPDYVKGRSIRMELFAILVGAELGCDDMLQGFRLALTKIVNFRSLVAPMCLAQSLMVALGHRLTEMR